MIHVATPAQAMQMILRSKVQLVMYLSPSGRNSSTPDVALSATPAQTSFSSRLKKESGMPRAYPSTRRLVMKPQPTTSAMPTACMHSRIGFAQAEYRIHSATGVPLSQIRNSKNPSSIPASAYAPLAQCRPPLVSHGRSAGNAALKSARYDELRNYDPAPIRAASLIVSLCCQVKTAIEFSYFK